jgi:hypothetical protein
LTLSVPPRRSTDLEPSGSATSELVN